MATSVLGPLGAGAEGGSNAPDSALVRFNAGKMNRVEGTRRITADRRKGLIYLEVGEDELLHFYWKERESIEPEEDLIIFPEDAEFIHVPQCNTGRVYALKFNSSSQILFFWMQDKQSEQDQSRIQRVNALIADPNAAESGQSLENILPSSHSNTEGTAASNANDRLLELFSQSAGGNTMDWSPSIRRPQPTDNAAAESVGQTKAAPVPGQADTSVGANPDRIRDLVQSLGERFQSQQQQAMSEPVSLSNVLTPSELRPLLQDENIRRGLFPYLPPELNPDSMTETEITNITSSPQFQQSLQGLSYALNQGDASGILLAVGLRPEDAQGEQGVMAFLRALERQIQREREEGQSGDAMQE